MVNWYYVIGSDRVGPVSIEAIKQLFLSEQITMETYVWKKGFPNWERLKDVAELKFEAEAAGLEIFTTKPEPVVAVKAGPVRQAKEATREIKRDILKEEKVEKVESILAETSSPEVFFSFDWKTVKENDELFFIKIGRDRKNYDGSNIFGPYSLVELKEALKERRINLETLVFSPGMNSWTKIQETPVNEHDHLKSAGHIGLNEVPLVLVFDYSPLPLVTVIKKAGVNGGVLLGAGPFIEFKDKTVKASLYIGNEIKVRDVKVQVRSYDKKDQSIECLFMDLNQDAKKIMLTHAV